MAHFSPSQNSRAKKKLIINQLSIFFENIFSKSLVR
jgi:hypothetical protein